MSVDCKQFWLNSISLKNSYCTILDFMITCAHDINYNVLITNNSNIKEIGMKVYHLILAACLISMTVAAFSKGEKLSFAAGNPNTEDGIKFVLMAPIDGNAKLMEIEGRNALTSDIKSLNPYMYFDINRKMLKTAGYPPFHVVVSIEYFDNSNNKMSIQYDAVGNGLEFKYKEISWNRTNTNKWMTKSIEIKDAQFGNGQQGVSDIRICADTESDISIASIKLECIGAADTDTRAKRPQQKITSKRWVTSELRKPVIIRPKYMLQEEEIALDRLISRIIYIGGEEPIVLNSLPKNPENDYDYIVVGMINSNPNIRDEFYDYGTTSKIDAIEDDSIREQSYLLVKDRYKAGNVVYALGKGGMGSVFAMAHIETHLWTDNGKLGIHLDKKASYESPDFKHRELYINIGYGLSRGKIAPDAWTLDEWKSYIDKLVLARYNAWSFYLWGDSQFAYPASKVNQDRNIYLHENLKEAIRYSHKRGLKVGYHIAPTMVPYDLYLDRPELNAVLEYPATGIVCPSKSESWDMIYPVYNNQLEWFKECNFFSIWFYDCAGCFCNVCKVPEQQLKTLIKQVVEMDKIIQRKNSKAEVQIVTWAIWRYERMHQYYLRDKFMEQINDLFKDRKDKLVISDGIYIDPGLKPLFPLANKYGIEANAFIYQTNIENGQPFGYPTTRYFDKWVPESKKAGAKRIHMMRMETLTKYPQDFVGGYYFWDYKTKGNDAIRLYSLYEAGDSEAGNLLYRAMLDIDDFTWYGYQAGAADAKRGELIYNNIKSALDMLPEKRRNDLEWLETTGKGYMLYGKAAEQMADEDSEGIEATMQEYRKALIVSPTFKEQVETDVWFDLNKSFVKYFYGGWENGHF